jgi:hypothetical protein
MNLSRWLMLQRSFTAETQISRRQSSGRKVNRLRRLNNTVSSVVCATDARFCPSCPSVREQASAHNLQHRGRQAGRAFVGFGTFEFCILNLFRISRFEFRVKGRVKSQICSTDFCANPKRPKLWVLQIRSRQSAQRPTSRTCPVGGYLWSRSLTVVKLAGYLIRRKPFTVA